MKRIVGGLMVRVAGTLRPVALVLREAPTPHCWRCSTQLYPGEVEYVPGDDPAFPWIAVCSGCVTDEDRQARG